MQYELLSRFISKSSEWSEFRKGREVFQSASELFNEVFQIDSGFFIYKKRLPSVSESFKVYSPWGIFKGPIDIVQTYIDENKPMLDDFVQSHNGKWLDVKDIPFAKKLNIPQLGYWNLVSRSETVGFIVLARSQPKTCLDANVISICAKQISLILDMMLAWRTADEMNRYDSLTEILNRKGIFDLHESIISNAEISGSNIMIGVLDIDNFKQINDCYGHQAGDRTLIEVAKTLKQHIRSVDIVGRFGGDEFVLIMQTQHKNFRTMEQRIEDLFPCSNGYSISVGFAVWNMDGNDWDTCYNMADKRLYRNKFIKKVHA
jgi:diguanylate cyclase (GGDEF)-like protein